MTTKTKKAKATPKAKKKKIYKKTYKKTHASTKALWSHIQKIKKRGGKFKTEDNLFGVTLTYCF